jgi:hypothetical protein
MEGSIFRCRAGNRPDSYLDIVHKVQFKTPHVIDTSNAIHATPMGNRSECLELKIVQLVTVLHDVSLNLGGVDPGDEVFHVPALR